MGFLKLPLDKEGGVIIAVERADCDLAGLRPTSQRASCGSGQSLSNVDPEKREHLLIS